MNYQGYQTARGQTVQELLLEALDAFQARRKQAATVVLAHPTQAPTLVPPPGVTVRAAEQVRPGTLQLGREETGAC